jgi:AcrR family transcriptional regulator
MPGNIRIRERKALNKKNIQDVAKAIFFERGYANSTIEEIAQRAGIGKGTLYYYFTTKDDLFLSLTFPLLEKINESLENIKRKLISHGYEDCREIIMVFCEHFINVYEFDPRGLRIVQAIQQEDLFLSMSEKAREEFSVKAKIGFELSREILAKATKMNLFPPLDHFEVIDSLWGSFMGIVQLEENKLKMSGKNHLRATVERAFTFFAGGICSADNVHLRQKNRSIDRFIK